MYLHKMCTHEQLWQLKWVLFHVYIEGNEEAD